jgi:hypothetical protein
MGHPVNAPPTGGAAAFMPVNPLLAAMREVHRRRDIQMRPKLGGPGGGHLVP